MRQALGQHFLKDQSVLRDIVETADVGENDIVIEIGPGHGELTSHILSHGPRKFIAIEKDAQLAAALKENLSKTGAEIIEGDVLKILPEVVDSLAGKKYKLIGNIPYYITGFLMRTLEGIDHKPESIVLLIQKEVAERICATPPKMNLLGASVQFWGKPEIKRVVKPGAFHPRPEVDSTVIYIEPHIGRGGTSSEEYYRFIKILFRQPRKTVVNNIRDGMDLPRVDIEKVLASKNLSTNIRPGDLNLVTIEQLSRVFEART